MSSEKATIEEVVGDPKPGNAEAIGSHAVISWLDCQIASLLSEVKGQEFWTVVMDPHTDAAYVRAIMQELYREIVGYQPDVIEAAIAAIAQMPRSMDPKTVRAMLFHQADEFDHGEMALRDYVGLGGNEAFIRAAKMTPESFAVAAVWWMIVRKRDPFAYLGALYLFEGLTPTVTSLIKGRLRQKGFGENALGYIEFHSTEDVKHASLVHQLIEKTVRDYPQSTESIKYGCECFRAVYPIPLWKAVFNRAKASHAAS